MIGISRLGYKINRKYFNIFNFPFTDHLIRRHCSLDGQRTSSRPPVHATHGLKSVVMNLLSSSVTPATKATYKRAYKNFLNFHNKYYPHKNLFPILLLHMAHFIAHSFQLGLKGTSIQTQVAGINYMHRMMGYGNLTDNFKEST